MSRRASERARRLGGGGIQTVIDELRGGSTSTDVAARHHLPVVGVDGVRSFYDFLRDPGVERQCTGTACHFSHGRDHSKETPTHPVRCLGRCYAPPSSSTSQSTSIPRLALSEPVVLRQVLGARPTLDDIYQLPSAPLGILGALEEADLRGRGGAAYPTAAKWRAAQQTPASSRYVVANGDEGDPGSFVDRLLLEEAPHSVLAGMLACAKTIRASRGVVYVRAEYPRAADIISAAIAEAESKNLLAGFKVEVHRGAGSYVCGEETALLRSLEGQRGEAQFRPPYPTESGLFGAPTVVQNIETLSLVPWVARHRRAPGSKAFCVSGAVKEPGVIEAAWGTPISELLAAAGGPPAGVTWKMALIGGPMGCVVPASNFDAQLSLGSLPRLGHGGIVVLDDTVGASALADHLFGFASAESCGSCTPCRVGTSRLARATDRASLERLLTTIEIGSMCGFGRGVCAPIRDLLRLYPDELYPGDPE